MQPKSDSLFHFTKSLDSLKGILREGFKPRYSLEDSRLLGPDYTAFPMCCFCDIPISRIGDHAAFYGEYGMGMTRDWGQRNSLHPVIYAVPGAIVAESLTQIFEQSREQKPEAQRTRELMDDIAAQFLQIIPYVKPIAGNMLISGSIIEKEFSQESEWRFVPEPHQLAFKGNFSDKKEELDQSVEDRALKFTPTDVRYIFVKSDHDIPLVFDFLQANLGQFPMNDVKILISRIVSLETLTRDI